MVKTKKLNASMIAVVLLSVFLVIVMVAGATLAWFASQDSADNNFLTADPVIVSVQNEDGITSGKKALTFTYPGSHLLPGTPIMPDLRAGLQARNTATLMRASLSAEIQFTSGQVPWGWKKNYLEKYEALFPGYENNDFDTPEELYQFLAETFIDIFLEDLPIEPFWEKDSASKDEFKGDSEGNISSSGYWFYYTGNGQEYDLKMTEVATNATSPNPVYGVTNAEYTKNYKRYTLTEEIEGEEGPETLPIPFGDNSIIASIDMYNDLVIPFLTTEFNLPTELHNMFANVKITLRFVVQGIQDYVRGINDEDEPTTFPPTLENVRNFFQPYELNKESTFPS